MREVREDGHSGDPGRGGDRGDGDRIESVLQEQRSSQAGDPGSRLLAYGLGAAAALRLGGRLTDRIGGGISCVIGLVITAAATAPFIVLSAHAGLPLVEALQFVRGIGVGLAGLPAMAAAFAAAPDHIEDATTTANIVQRVGGSLGSALLVIVLAAHADQAGYQFAFALLTGGAVLALVAALWLAVEQRRTAGHSSPSSIGGPRLAR